MRNEWPGLFITVYLLTKHILPSLLYWLFPLASEHKNTALGPTSPSRYHPISLLSVTMISHGFLTRYNLILPLSLYGNCPASLWLHALPSGAYFSWLLSSTCYYWLLTLWHSSLASRHQTTFNFTSWTSLPGNVFRDVPQALVLIALFFSVLSSSLHDFTCS